jgi:hypothetical protein
MLEVWLPEHVCVCGWGPLLQMGLQMCLHWGVQEGLQLSCLLLTSLGGTMGSLSVLCPLKSLGQQEG